MESPSRARLVGRRSVLRLFAAAPAVAALTAACSSTPEPDPLVALATAAKSDAQLARAIAQAHPRLAAAAREVAAARTAHAEALQREIDRVNPRDPQDPPSVPEPGPQTAPHSANAAANALLEALRVAQENAAQLVPGLSDYRAGLVGSVSASCACLREVLG
ncbi:hypothetical protein GCM10011581_09380 [Saccharopolyspora subtropica]|uniref:Uncharacterized protein n=1 Tax=Saccharopolyspora thermophila TaxID=89367 RepID=A0A917N7E8_9PSEU|nr:hypothetical protein [Saccharopolyspora subtropica]GGI74532.1 hypothetical protein GCM10011581_09380 [Saccharopolyspora subtropica]